MEHRKRAEIKKARQVGSGLVGTILDISRPTRVQNRRKTAAGMLDMEPMLGVGQDSKTISSWKKKDVSEIDSIRNLRTLVIEAELAKQIKLIQSCLQSNSNHMLVKR